MAKKNDFTCSRCGGKAIGKPVRIAFFIDDGGKLTDKGLPDDMIRAIEKEYCGVCAVRIMQEMYPVERVTFPMVGSGRRKTKRLTPEKREQIYEMHRNGKTCAEIAKAMGVYNSAIGYHINRLNRRQKKSDP